MVLSIWITKWARCLFAELDVGSIASWQRRILFQLGPAIQGATLIISLRPSIIISLRNIWNFEFEFWARQFQLGFQFQNRFSCFWFLEDIFPGVILEFCFLCFLKFIQILQFRWHFRFFKVVECLLLGLILSLLRVLERGLGRAIGVLLGLCMFWCCALVLKLGLCFEISFAALAFLLWTLSSWDPKLCFCFLSFPSRFLRVSFPWGVQPYWLAFSEMTFKLLEDGKLHFVLTLVCNWLTFGGASEHWHLQRVLQLKCSRKIMANFSNEFFQGSGQRNFWEGFLLRTFEPLKVILSFELPNKRTQFYLLEKCSWSE